MKARLDLNDPDKMKMTEENLDDLLQLFLSFITASTTDKTNLYTYLHYIHLYIYQYL